MTEDQCLKIAEDYLSSHAIVTRDPGPRAPVRSARYGVTSA
jgi:hypothetical protein